MKPADLLHAAVKSRDLVEVRAILKKNPEAARTPRPVLAAAGAAWQEALGLLVRHGADLNALWRGYRPLHAMIQESPHAHGGKPGAERIACMEWILAHGADPEMEGAWPPSRALLTAAFTGVPEYITVLRAAGAKVDGFVRIALGEQVQVDPQTRTRPGDGMTALHCSCASRIPSKHRLAIARSLLDRGADPNALCKGWNHQLDAAYFAAGSKQLDTFELLLERGANVDAALVHAIWQKGTALAAIALRHGADVNRARDDGKPLLNQMIRWGQLPQTFWLLSQGASPNIPDERGWTAVHQAASRGNARMLKAVLEAGGDLRAKDNDHHTPLDVAKFGVRRLAAAFTS